MTQLAIQSIDTYKDDPRVKNSTTPNSTDTSHLSTSAAEMSFLEYKRKLDSLVLQGQADLAEANNVLALGWKKNPTAEAKTFTFYDGASKALGFLLTALAICLGAPFWFDLLNKLVKLRGTGTKETSESSSQNKNSKGAGAVPVIIKTSAGEEAVG